MNRTTIKNFLNPWKLTAVTFQLFSIIGLFSILWLVGDQYHFNKSMTEKDVRNLTHFQQRFPEVLNLKDPSREKMIIDAWTEYALKADRYISESHEAYFKIFFQVVCVGIGLNCFLIYIICHRLKSAK